MVAYSSVVDLVYTNSQSNSQAFLTRFILIHGGIIKRFDLISSLFHGGIFKRCGPSSH